MKSLLRGRVASRRLCPLCQKLRWVQGLADFLSQTQENVCPASSYRPAIEKDLPRRPQFNRSEVCLSKQVLMRLCRLSVGGTTSSYESIREGGIHLEARTSNCARILVVENCEPFRRTVCLILQQRAGLDVVGQAGDGLEAVTKATELRPDLIFLDIGLPKQNGLQAVRQIRKHTPESKILFLSQESDPEIVQEALNLGASGYVAKMVVAKEELIAATRAVLRGEQFISGILAGDLLRRQPDTLPP